VWVNAGAGAVRVVVVGLEVPPLGVLAGGVVLVVGVVGGFVLVCGAVDVVVVCDGGVLATDTVLVLPPQPVSRATPGTPRRSTNVDRKPRLMTLMIFAARIRRPIRAARHALDVIISDC
jgi:hypothetical protein